MVKLVGTIKEFEDYKKSSFFYNFGKVKMIVFCIILIGITNTVVTNIEIRKEAELNRQFIASLNYTKKLYKDDHRKLAQAMNLLIKDKKDKL